MDNKEKYTICVNYSTNEKSFEEILKKYIENILKQPLWTWKLQKFDVKYK